MQNADADAKAKNSNTNTSTRRGHMPLNYPNKEESSNCLTSDREILKKQKR